tara:strand:- start:1945 stop:2112 length:168 start_codon:yes stop_codon:yes gene_type:complete
MISFSPNTYQLAWDDEQDLLPLLDIQKDLRGRAMEKYDDLDDYEVQQELAEFGVS